MPLCLGERERLSVDSKVNGVQVQTLDLVWKCDAAAK